MLGVGDYLMFFKKSLILTKGAFIQMFFYLNIFWNVIYSCVGKAEFSAATSGMWCFKNHYNVLIWCSKLFLIIISVENS